MSDSSQQPQPDPRKLVQASYKRSPRGRKAAARRRAARVSWQPGTRRAQPGGQR